MQQTICQAIAARNLIRFYYTGETDPGYRTVEPHMVAYTKDGNLALSAWYVSGASGSMKGPGWRIYLLSAMSSVSALDQQFKGTRPGYQPTGGKSFTRVQCAL